MVPSLAGLAPFQIAFVVHDLELAAREFDARLAAGPWRGWIFGPQGERREYRGAPVEWTLKLALNDRTPSVRADRAARRPEHPRRLAR
jgi:hypothetical protein